MDIVKKAIKWICKICGEKQTLRQEFGRGNGKECRNHVKLLNEKYQRQPSDVFEDLVKSHIEDSSQNTAKNEIDFDEVSNESLPSQLKTDFEADKVKSKWNNYLDICLKENDPEEPSVKRMKKIHSAQEPNTSDNPTSLVQHKNDDLEPETIPLASTSKIYCQISSTEINKIQQISVKKSSKWNQFIVDHNPDPDESN